MVVLVVAVKSTREFLRSAVPSLQFSFITFPSGGFSGFSGSDGYEPIELTVDKVADIHHSGGKPTRRIVLCDKLHLLRMSISCFYVVKFTGVVE